MTYYVTQEGREFLGEASQRALQARVEAGVPGAAAKLRHRKASSSARDDVRSGEIKAGTARLSSAEVQAAEKSGVGLTSGEEKNTFYPPSKMAGTGHKSVRRAVSRAEGGAASTQRDNSGRTRVFPKTSSHPGGRWGARRQATIAAQGRRADLAGSREYKSGTAAPDPHGGLAPPSERRVGASTLSFGTTQAPRPFGTTTLSGRPTKQLKAGTFPGPARASSRAMAGVKRATSRVRSLFKKGN